MTIDWDSSATVVLSNPRLDEDYVKQITRILNSEIAPQGLVWFSTSGSLSQKWVGLTRNALLESAKAVNIHLSSCKSDIWVLPLPVFHVGGQGIIARSYLSSSKYYQLEKWSPLSYCEIIDQYNGTLSSLVPAQVHDLVQHNLIAPPSLRAVVVGGGALPENLYHNARKLGWPLLPSYGMTECASQIATANLSSLKSTSFPQLEILTHIQAETDESNRLKINSPSLLSCYATLDIAIQFTKPVINGWFIADDMATIKNNCIEILGRGEDFIKIGGESILLSRLDKIWYDACALTNTQADSALVPIEDDRLGHSIHLFSTDIQNTEAAVEFFNSKVLPFERIRVVHLIESIPRSPLGKLMRNKIISSLK